MTSQMHNAIFKPIKENLKEINVHSKLISFSHIYKKLTQCNIYIIYNI